MGEAGEEEVARVWSGRAGVAADDHFSPGDGADGKGVVVGAGVDAGDAVGPKVVSTEPLALYRTTAAAKSLPAPVMPATRILPSA